MRVYIDSDLSVFGSAPTLAHTILRSQLVLPPIVDEGSFTPFKFWFNNSVQDGMYYRSELFCRLQSVPARYRAQLYHYACRLAQKESVVISAGAEQYSIWVGLRSPNAIELITGNCPLPSFLQFVHQPSVGLGLPELVPPQSEEPGTS